MLTLYAPERADVRRIIELIDGRPHGPVPLRVLSQTLGRSEAYLGRMFRQQRGLTIREYIARRSIEYAATSIAQGEKIEAVALEVGYRSKKNFYRQFRRRFGVTPGTYRRNATPTLTALDTPVTTLEIEYRRHPGSPYGVEGVVTMSGTSMLWIGSPHVRGTHAKLERARSEGLLPLQALTVESAIHLLGQFRVHLVVLHVTDQVGWEDCARVIAGGSPVVAMVDSIDRDATRRYLQAGCAAVATASCPSETFAGILTRVAAGHRDVVWPNQALAAVS